MTGETCAAHPNRQVGDAANGEWSQAVYVPLPRPDVQPLYVTVLAPLNSASLLARGDDNEAAAAETAAAVVAAAVRAAVLGEVAARASDGNRCEASGCDASGPDASGSDGRCKELVSDMDAEPTAWSTPAGHSARVQSSEDQRGQPRVVGTARVSLDELVLNGPALVLWAPLEPDRDCALRIECELLDRPSATWSELVQRDRKQAVPQPLPVHV